jgi:hypothetical protein
LNVTEAVLLDGLGSGWLELVMVAVKVSEPVAATVALIVSCEQVANRVQPEPGAVIPDQTPVLEL